MITGQRAWLWHHIFKLQHHVWQSQWMAAFLIRLVFRKTDSASSLWMCSESLSTPYPPLYHHSLAHVFCLPLSSSTLISPPLPYHPVQCRAGSFWLSLITKRKLLLSSPATQHFPLGFKTHYEVFLVCKSSSSQLLTPSPVRWVDYAAPLPSLSSWFSIFRCHSASSWTFSGTIEYQSASSNQSRAGHTAPPPSRSPVVFARVTVVCPASPPLCSGSSIQ